MPVWVWEVHRDYYCIMATVEANTKKEAFEAVKQSDLPPFVKEELFQEDPEESERGKIAYLCSEG